MEKQSQTNPILPASAGKIALSVVEGPIKTTPGFAGLNQLATIDWRPAAISHRLISLIKLSKR
jgi:hypothetical protein